MFTTIPENQITGQEAWRTDARCASLDGTLAATFFSEELQDIAVAKRICAACPVLEGCLEGALDRYEPYGVWGGQLFLNGKVLTNKRRRGRPPKVARPEDDFPIIAVPERLMPMLRTA
ncbi:MAG: WhiB family redox-sensing transcriptional regulator [Acidimicrobiales bacterium]|jgi:WhiB family redox-sensing transcriptional regulator|tara:strand:- start:315 stop:668 length:354 start_codon:yes stop_codon:yes gene_type:complete